jgi:hypothetical protein
MTNNCGAKVVACYCDTECAAINTCGAECVTDGGVLDQTCFNACGAAHPNGVSKYNDMIDCRQVSCGNDAGTGVCD